MWIGVVETRIHVTLRQTRRLPRRQPTMGRAEACISHGCFTLFCSYSFRVWIVTGAMRVHAEGMCEQLDRSYTTSEPSK